MLEFKTFHLHIKALGEDGTFEGFAAIVGNVDMYDDVIEPGAFAKTLTERPEVPILWQHDVEEPIGLANLSVDVTGNLRAIGRLNLEVQRAREIHALLRQGAVKGISIGYETIKQTWDKVIRRLKELRVWEISLVMFPANPFALVSAVKGHRLLDMESKSVTPFSDLVLAPRDHPWDASAAVMRVRAWAGADEAANAAYSRAFVWYDGAADDPDGDGWPDAFGAWKLPIADVLDGELVAVPRGIFAAANSIVRPPGTPRAVDVPEGDISRIRNHLGRYYDKMALVFDDESIVAPWEGGGKEGRVLSGSNQALVEQAIEALQALLDAAEPATGPLGSQAAVTMTLEPAVAATLRRAIANIRPPRREG